MEFVISRLELASTGKFFNATWKNNKGRPTDKDNYIYHDYLLQNK